MHSINDGFVVEERRSGYGVKIKVIGVGGGGGNMINHIVREGIHNFDYMQGVDLIAANTDMQALDNSSATTKIQLGEKKTQGLGAGAIPEVGEESAKESFEEIKATLEYANIVFIAAGFGGGTGTGAAPIIARAAKEVGALTVAVVTTPFGFEGKKRMRHACEGIEELKKECDSVVVVPNQRLVGLVGPKAGFKDSFKIVDDILARAVSGMSAIVLSSGKSDMNLDFADVKTVMSNRGLALMGVGEATGEGAAQEAIKNAIQSPLLDDVSIKGARGALVHFKFHPNCPLNDISEAMSIVDADADADATIIFGTMTDESFAEDCVQVTLVATGFEVAKEPARPAATEQVSHENVATPIANDNTLSVFKRAAGHDVLIDIDDLDKPAVSRYSLD